MSRALNGQDDRSRSWREDVSVAVVLLFKFLPLLQQTVDVEVALHVELLQVISKGVRPLSVARSEEVGGDGVAHLLTVFSDSLPLLLSFVNAEPSPVVVEDLFNELMHRSHLDHLVVRSWAKHFWALVYYFMLQMCFCSGQIIFVYLLEVLSVSLEVIQLLIRRQIVSFNDLVFPSSQPLWLLGLE